MKRRRRFVDGECNHIYQRTVNGFNIFYDLEDYLVFYMILSTSARKFKVRILKICLMVDHIHILLEAESCKEMADFVRYYSSVFVREFNDSIGREGQLMYKSFGSAPKKGDKKTRSASVTVSIAAETIGVWRVMSLVNLVDTSTVLGRTSECAGISNTSSKVSPSIIGELVNVCISYIKFGKCNHFFGNIKGLEGFSSI